MRLTDLLQLIDDLNINTLFFLKREEHLFPLGKLTIEDGQCFLYPGQKAMTKNKLVKLVGQMHNRGIPLFFIFNGHKYNIFGLQIQEEKRRAILL